MRSTSSPSRPRPSLAPLVLVLVALVAACDAGAVPGATSAPAGSIPRSGTAPGATAPLALAPTPTAAPPTRPPTTPSPAASPASPDALGPGSLAVTVTADLRVRSQPRVDGNSRKYTPLLPQGTRLIVIGGPVKASGFTWVQVSPVAVAIAGGIDAGWVAIADHDGTPWVKPAADPTPGYELASVQVGRSTPTARAATSAAASEAAFGIALYKRMLGDPSLDLKDKGVVMSPYSIATALAMARAGAKGSTAAEMDAALHVRGWDRLGAGLSSLDQLLAARDATWADYDGGQHWLSLRTANMAFGQHGYPIAPAFLARIGRAFGAGLGSVDYVNDLAGAREAINGWVKRQTLGRIPALLGPSDLSPATRLTLVNAVYLKAEWALPFDPASTTARRFTTARGTTVTVPTMTRFGGQDVVLAKGNGWRATDLRYVGSDDSRPLAMTLILPDDMRTFETRLSPDVLAGVDTTLAAEHRRIAKTTYPSNEQDSCGWYPYETRLFLPRFGVDTRAGLVPSLQALGIRSAFDPGLADFSDMTTTAEPLFIGTVIHQANIDVDEVGTTAAAATAIGMDTGGCTGPSPRATKILRFDKPFMYVIRDVRTGAILFMGRVMDPSTRS